MIDWYFLYEKENLQKYNLNILNFKKILSKICILNSAKIIFKN